MSPVNSKIQAAIADSIATAQPISVAISVDEIQDIIGWILLNYDDVDYDHFPNRITIFGDDPSVSIPDDGEGDEGHFVLHLVFPVTQSNPYAE